MLALMDFCIEREQLSMVQTEIAGLPCLKVMLPWWEGNNRWRERFRRRKLERAFRTYGVSRILLPNGSVLPDDFPHRAVVETMPFYREIADLLVLNELETKHIPFRRAVVRLRGGGMTREAEQAAHRLCPMVRGISVDMGRGGEALALRLYRQCGMAIYGPERADVTVSFAGGEGGTSVIDLSGKRSVPSGLRATAPRLGLPRSWEEPLLAVLWSCGRLSRGEISVKQRDEGFPLDKSIQSTYNSIEPRYNI